MPTSHYCQISKIMDLITILNPSSILDIGIGFGKYGVLCREYLELWNRKDSYRDFTKRIDGIEIFEDYITPVHRFVYDNLYIGDVLKLAEKNDFRYDLVLLIDVLEHLDKVSGSELIRTLIQNNESVLIAVPKDIGSQGKCFDNPFEAHKARWSKRELRKLGNAICINELSSYIVYLASPDKLSRTKRDLRAAKVKRFLISFYLFRWLRQRIRKRKA